MNSEEFIKKHLTGAVRSDHCLALSVSKKIINKTYVNISYQLIKEVVDSENAPKSNA